MHVGAKRRGRSSESELCNFENALLISSTLFVETNAVQILWMPSRFSISSCVHSAQVPISDQQ